MERTEGIDGKEKGGRGGERKEGRKGWRVKENRGMGRQRGVPTHVSV